MKKANAISMILIGCLAVAEVASADVGPPMRVESVGAWEGDCLRVKVPNGYFNSGGWLYIAKSLGNNAQIQMELALAALVSGKNVVIDRVSTAPSCWGWTDRIRHIDIVQ